MNGNVVANDFTNRTIEQSEEISGGGDVDRTDGDSVGDSGVAISEGGVDGSPSKSRLSTPKRRTLRHGSKASPVTKEMEELEAEIEAINTKASLLERRVRRTMEKGDKDAEDALMEKWLALVNRRNALIRRQMQLNILEKEENLERRFESLNRELRALMAIEEWRKTEAQKTREKSLLEDLVTIIDGREELVRHQDIQERGIEEDAIVESAVRNRQLPAADAGSQEKQCIVQ